MLLHWQILKPQEKQLQVLHTFIKDSYLSVKLVKEKQKHSYSAHRKDCIHGFIFIPSSVFVIQCLVSSIIQIESFQHVISYKPSPFVLRLSPLRQKVHSMIFAIMRTLHHSSFYLYTVTLTRPFAYRSLGRTHPW